jgi:hypothetical protein
MTYLSRYLAGEHRQVWADLQALGEDVRREPVLSDARAVAEETMHRVRRNVEKIEARLRALEYDFELYPDEQERNYMGSPTRAPSSESASDVQTIREAVGPIPLSLEAFFNVVGSVDFVGYHPWWPEMSDPLVVDLPEVMLGELEEWQDWAETDPDDAGPFMAPFAPDAYHKDNVSGGPAYAIQLPDPAMDAPVQNGPVPGQLFVEYLREAILERGGFAGFPDRSELRPKLRALNQGLEPF